MGAEGTEEGGRGEAGRGEGGMEVVGREGAAGEVRVVRGRLRRQGR
jgi:hypothetical protein